MLLLSRRGYKRGSPGGSPYHFTRLGVCKLEASIFRRLLFVICRDSALVLAHKRSSSTRFEHLLWIQVAVKLDELPDQPCPTRLVTGPRPAPLSPWKYS